MSKRLLCTALVLIGCSSSSVTAVQVDVRYETSWGLDHLSVAVRDKTATTDMASSVRVLVPDDWAGQSQTVEVFGLKGAQKQAHGKVNFMPLQGQEVHALVVLARLPCGIWCSDGEKSCSGDAVVTCTERSSCFEWSEPVPCPPDAPHCSLGVCSAQCTNECAMSETRCEGPSGVRTCGQADSDTCLDWLPVVACSSGQTCSNGHCGTQCQDECQPGQKTCLGSGVASCMDANADGCLEWEPIVPCASGTTCSNGQCAAQCQDDCTGSSCQNNTYYACGQYDLDSCQDRSPGVSCIPSDSCKVGSCTSSGCTTSAKPCNQPPASQCLSNGTKKRVYSAQGTCQSGSCSYSYQDTDCPNCPSCDPCLNVTCNAPPSVCYASGGTCSNGQCSYPYANGASCDDGNACTTGDQCSNGSCAGTTMSCNSPPAPICTTSAKLRTFRTPGTCSAGTCGYPFTDTTCAYGCSGGACNPPACTAAGCQSQGQCCNPSVGCGPCCTASQCQAQGKCCDPSIGCVVCCTPSSCQAQGQCCDPPTGCRACTSACTRSAQCSSAAVCCDEDTHSCRVTTASEGAITRCLCQNDSDCELFASYCHAKNPKYHPSCHSTLECKCSLF